MFKMLEFFTDGSSMKGEGSYAYVVVQEKIIVKKVARLVTDGTNNRSELLGALRAMRDPIGFREKRVIIITDSAYVYNNILKGYVFRWRDNDWKLANGDPVANVDLWTQLLDRLEQKHYEFRGVSAHVKNPKKGSDEYYNNIADELAQSILRQSLKTLKELEDISGDEEEAE